MVPVESLVYEGGNAHSGYYQSEYSQQAHTPPYQTHMKSRYGHGQADGLQPPCVEVLAPCGFMRVVPVYPVYQRVIESVSVPGVNVPTVHITEPEPVYHYEPEVIHEPAPVYEPAPYHWPEPEAQVPSWKPLRK